MRSLISLATLSFALTNVYAFTGKTCRIMPIGASITFGVGSSQGNGYRDDLYNLLANDGNTVNMVGTQKGGTFHDPDNEGWPGKTITEVNEKVQISMPINRPNIATILVGTNDMIQGKQGDAQRALGQLIDDVLNWPPLTFVIVSTLPPNKDPIVNDRIKAFNAAIPGIVQQRVNAGRSVHWVDSYGVVALSDLVDGTHPNDQAFERIGRKFYEGLQHGFSKGWIFDVQGPAP